MTDDSERREVARRLREYSGGRKAFHLGRLCAACGIDKSRLMSRTTDADAEAWAHLADLIEPSGHECVPGECPLNVRHDSDFIDREALLELADEIEEHIAQWSGIEDGDASDIVFRIREAVGE